MIRLDRLDHLVLTVASIETSCAFYSRVLGMEVKISSAGRYSLQFGRQKINLHEAGHEFEPKASKPTPGSADLCFISGTPLEELVAHVEGAGAAVELPPSARSGATGPIRSIYLRDPDGNLIEISNLL